MDELHVFVLNGRVKVCNNLKCLSELYSTAGNRLHKDYTLQDQSLMHIYANVVFVREDSVWFNIDLITQNSEWAEINYTSKWLKMEKVLYKLVYDDALNIIQKS